MTEVQDTETCQTCSRCKTEPSVVLARKEKFCGPCFVKFLSTKQRKQMAKDKFKVKYGKDQGVLTKVLLCLSFGESSLALLDMLITALKEQSAMHRGKQGYAVTCLTLTDGSNSSEIKASIRALKSAYKIQEVAIEFKILDINSYVPDNDSLQKITLYKDFSSLSTSINNTCLSKLNVQDLLSLCSHRTTKSDLLEIIYQDLYMNTAKAEKCDTILFGHNMTKLADDIIALTVKGRGSLINEKLTDGLIKSETNLEVIHPLRDVLATEIKKYVEIRGVSRFLIKDPNADEGNRMTKYKTVNELTRAYFQNLDKDYSEVVSTVVKIGSKLATPTSAEDEVKSCQICGANIYKDPRSWLTKITVNDGAPVESEEDLAVLKLYQESTDAALEVKNGNEEDICYGCIVTMGDVKSLIWPTRRQEIINDYVLTDDEDE